MVRQAFMPCLQYQYASGKNTADIALALDAMEAMFDHRAHSFCLVSAIQISPVFAGNFASAVQRSIYRRRSKKPDALRNASDQFFAWQPAALGSDTGEQNGNMITLPKPDPAKSQALRQNKSELLLLLDMPELPLHTNGSEGDIRGPVQKQKICGGKRSDPSRKCRDTLPSLKKTCRQLGISFCGYWTDRLSFTHQIQPSNPSVNSASL